MYKFCKYCRHRYSFEGPPLGGSFPFSGGIITYNLCLFDGKIARNLVTGEPLDSCSSTCEDERGDGGKCGPEGKNYKSILESEKD